MWNTTPARPVVAADEITGVKRTCNPIQPFGGIPDFQDLIVGYANFCAASPRSRPTPAAIKEYVQKTDLPGVTAPDDKTIVFKLTHPASYFQDMLTLTAFSPAPVEWHAYTAPGNPRPSGCLTDSSTTIPRWVDPVAWDSAGALYTLWTTAAGVWLAQSENKGATWTTVRVATAAPDTALDPYLFSKRSGNSCGDVAHLRGGLTPLARCAHRHEKWSPPSAYRCHRGWGCRRVGRRPAPR